MVTIVGQDDKYVKNTSCEHCAAKLQYTESEVKRFSGKDYSGGPAGSEWVDCPRCGKQAIIRQW